MRIVYTTKPEYHNESKPDVYHEIDEFIDALTSPFTFLVTEVVLEPGDMTSYRGWIIQIGKEVSIGIDSPGNAWMRRAGGYWTPDNEDFPQITNPCMLALWCDIYNRLCGNDNRFYDFENGCPL